MYDDIIWIYSFSGTYLLPKCNWVHVRTYVCIESESEIHFTEPGRQCFMILQLLWLDAVKVRVGLNSIVIVVILIGTLTNNINKLDLKTYFI